MIVAHLKDMWRYNDLIPCLADVYRFAINSMDLEPGRYELGEGVYAMVKEGVSKQQCGEEFEAHKGFIDVHFLVSGRERIWWRDIGGLPVSRPYNEQKDNIFYLGNGGSAIDLSPLEFCLCYPEDGHKANLAVNEPQAYKKIVFKIPIGNSKLKESNE